MQPRRNIIVLAVTSILVIISSTSVFAQSGLMAEREALRSLFQDGAQSLSYTQQFKNAVSINQVDNIADSIEDQLGRFVRVEGEGNPFTLRFANGRASARMVLAEDGAVAGLQFMQVVPATATLDEAVAALLDRPGTTSITIISDGETIVSSGATCPLPVGSAFKLAVLVAVEDAVAEKQSSWDDVLSLEESDISLPSGLTQEWPVGTSITVETAAILMISRSDNTMTDLLIRHVGRKAVEEYAPNSQPLLTTREFFLLKAQEQSEERERFLSATESGRRHVLRNLEGELPPASLFAGDPVHPEIEWFFTTAELARLIERSNRLDILGVNPGPVDPDEWQAVGFKGGSEPGVINITLRLHAASGHWYAVSANWSRKNAAVDNTAFVNALQSVLTHLD